MRFIISLLAVTALVTPAFAAEGQSPVLVKGGKSYQIRYAKPLATPANVEPAAGVEMDGMKAEKAPAAMPSIEQSSPVEKKVMKLHGRK